VGGRLTPTLLAFCFDHGILTARRLLVPCSVGGVRLNLALDVRGDMAEDT
jgi:hypothetical protein